MKRIIIWGVTGLALIGFVVGLVYLAKQDAAKKPAGGNAVPPKEVTTADHAVGPATAPVTLIEYSDFQCPACGFFHPILKQLTTEYAGRIRFVYRYYPLQEIHLNATISARAAEAAAVQGKFWEMHDLLFEKQSEWSGKTSASDTFIEYAKSLGMNVEQFTKDLSASSVADTVASDYQSGNAAGVQGTPTFFLNGFRIENPRSYDEFKSVIERALISHP